MSDDKIRYAYRFCPCFRYDIEGIQTWLEDMAAQGLVLEADGIFLGIKKVPIPPCTYQRKERLFLRFCRRSRCGRAGIQQKMRLGISGPLW